MEKVLRFGENTPIEQQLIKEGKIRKIGEAIYELKNKYYINGRGDIAIKGDQFVVINGEPYRVNQ